MWNCFTASAAVTLGTQETIVEGDGGYISRVQDANRVGNLLTSNARLLLIAWSKILDAGMFLVRAEQVVEFRHDQVVL
jgi:hypothetical protein